MTDTPLKDFADSAEPPAHLRGRVEDTLRARGLRGPRRPSWYQPAAAAAAAALVLAAALGFLAGRMTPAGAAEEPRYLLLLVGDAQTDKPEAELVAEYTRWADSLRRERRLVLAERLADDQLVLPAGSAGSEADARISGFFLVQAPSLDSARALAEAGPHLRYGGQVVVRPIDHR